MSDPKIHHYIPIFIQKNFSDAQAKLWCYPNIHSQPFVGHSGPKALFCAEHLYSSIEPDGRLDTWVETKKLSRIDQIFSNFLGQVIAGIRTGRRPILDEMAWRDWSDFLFYQMKRNPSHYRKSAEQADFVNHLKNTAAEFLEESGESDEHISAIVQILLKNSFVGTVGSPQGEKAREAFALPGLTIFRPKSAAKSFILGDGHVYLVTSKPAAHPIHKKNLVVPIASDIALAPNAWRGRVEVINLADEAVRSINEGIASQSTRIAGRSRELVHSLSKFVGNFNPKV